MAEEGKRGRETGGKREDAKPGRHGDDDEKDDVYILKQQRKNQENRAPICVTRTEYDYNVRIEEGRRKMRALPRVRLSHPLSHNLRTP